MMRRGSLALLLLLLLAPVVEAQQQTASPRNYLRRAAGVYHAVDYGVTCNGTTDDTAAFNAAFAAAGVGATIVVPGCGSAAANYYKVTGLVLLNRQTLVGSGRGITIISCIAPSQVGVSSASTNQFWQVRGLTVRDCAVGIDLRGQNFVNVADVTLDANARGIYIGTSVGSIYNVVQRTRILGSTTRDLDTDTTGTAVVNANQFLNSQFESTAGVSQFTGGGNGAAGNLFAGNVFNNGLSVLSASGLAIIGNYFEGGTIAVTLNGVRGVTVSGNYFFNWGSGVCTATTCAAIRLGPDGALGVRIDANSFWNGKNNTSGIHVPVAASTTGDLMIGANHHDAGGFTYTRVTDAMTVPATLRIGTTSDATDLLLGSVTFANLPAAPNGSVVYCTTCLRGSVPCSGASTGSKATRENGAWNCD